MVADKRGELTTKEIVQVILAAGAIFVMVFLLWRLLAPGFDVNRKAAESYFDSFVEAVDSGDGEFLMWQPEGDVKFFVVYFGDRWSVEKEIWKGKEFVEFFLTGDRGNAVCLCYVSEGEKSECEYCGNLDFPARYGAVEEGWVIGVGERVRILKGEDFYEIR